jgi:hypothetical protein
LTANINLEKNVDHLVREFLLSQVPEEIRFVYCIVTSLKYPILDSAALDGQINEHQDPKEAEVVTGFFNSALLKGDFPLKGPRWTLEILTARIQTFIPWVFPSPFPIGIGLGGGHSDDFSGPGVCLQAVRPFYEYCYNTARSASPEIQRLEQLACHGRALGAVIQCNEKLRTLGFWGIWERFTPCGRRARRRYAECIVHRVLNNEDPAGCISTYKANIYRCRFPYLSW